MTHLGCTLPPARRRGGLAAFCLLAAANVCAAEPSATTATPLAPIRVVAEAPDPLADAMQDTTTLDAQRLQASTGESLAEILGQVPGVQFTTSGGPQTVANLYLRGASSSQTLVLLNGLRINDAGTAGALLPAIDPAQIDHIDIARGAAASLHGADAIGGAINIITERKSEPDTPSTWVNLGAGSHNTVKSSLGLAGAAGGWDYGLVASAARSQGFDATRPTTESGQANFQHNPDRDGYRSNAVSGSLGYEWTAGHRIALTAYDGFMHGDYDAGLVPAEAYTLYRQQAYSLESSDRVATGWQSVLRFGYTRDTSEDRSGYPSTFDSMARHYSWRNTFQLPAQGELSLLVEHREENVGGSTDYTRNSRDLNALALAWKGRFGRLHTEASLRDDKYSGLAQRTTGSLALAVDLTDTLQIGVAANTAFRVPTFNDLYYPGFSGLYKGNPSLKPETSKNVEAHVAYVGTNSQWRITAFQNKVDNLIATGAAPPYSPGNIGHATIRGLTLDGSTHVSGTTLQASLDLLDPRNDNPRTGEDSRLPLRARQVFHAGVRQRMDGLELGAQFQYTGARIDAFTHARLGGYSLLGLVARYELTRSLALQVRWDNVLSKRYAPLDGYSSPGSNVFVNVSWRSR